MGRKRLAVLSILAIFVFLAGCGRRQSAVPTDGGGGGDGTYYDTGIVVDRGTSDGVRPDRGKVDGPPPCVPDCRKICALQKDCGLIPASGVAECEKQCSANPGTPELTCLGQLACRPTADCNAAKQCKANPKAPDLTVSHTASSPGAGKISYQAKVCNVGNGPAGTFTVHFYRNRSAAPKAGQKGNHVVTVSSLNAGVCRTVNASDTGLSTGGYNTWTQADPESSILETDETNNVGGPVAVKVTGTAPDKPDLVISNMLVQVSSSAGTADYLATVCNIGKGAAAASTLDIYRNSATMPPASKAGDVSKAVAALAAGGCTSVSYKTKLTSGKTYTSWARADRPNTVAESTESNNRFGPVKFTVGGTTKLPDLVVTSMTVTTSKTGGVFKISVCNQGTASSAKTSYLWLFANLASKPGANSKYTKTIGIAALAAGVCKSLTWSVSAKAGSYKAWALIDAKNVIKESTESNNTYGPVPWTVVSTTQKPDLTVLGMTATATPSGSVTYKANVCNSGAGATGKAFTVGLFTNRSSAPTASSAANAKASVTALAAGACKTVSWTVTLKSGTYSSWALADLGNAVSETAEGNNYYGPVKVTIAAPAPKPDLYISTMTANQSGSGTYTYYQISVCNKGTVISSYSTLELYLHRTSKPGASTPGNLTTTVTNLAPGTCQTRTFSTVISPGTYKSWAYIDRSNVIAEVSETNNTFGPVTVKVPGTGKPDLQVINVSASQANGYVYYYMTICNKGMAMAGNSYVDVYYHLGSAPNGSKPGNISTHVGALNTGACTTRTAYTNLPGGSYKSWVYVDRSNVVFESNEKNNTYGPVAVKVTGTGKSDLQITNVSTSPYSTGYTMYYVTVCNKGTATASTARIDLYYNRTTKPKVTDVGERYTSTTTLTAGACTTRNIYAMLGPGVYSSYLWIDRTNAVLESNENNNIYGPVKVTVGSTGSADLYISSFKAAANSSGTTTYSITVCNNGTTASGSTTLDLYYNRSYTPSQYTAGNRQIAVKGLSSKGCVSLTANANLSAGTYSSWVRVDRSNSVTETNENNNVSGPLGVVVGSTANMCSYICSVLINTCKTFLPAQLGLCLSVCGSQTQTNKQCAYKQAQASNCNAIIQC